MTNISFVDFAILHIIITNQTIKYSELSKILRRKMDIAPQNIYFHINKLLSKNYLSKIIIPQNLNGKGRLVELYEITTNGDTEYKKNLNIIKDILNII